MKHLISLGIIIVATIGIIYALIYGVLGFQYYDFRNIFGEWSNDYAIVSVVASVTCFIIGICFGVSSIGILQHRLWGKRWFLIAILANIIIETAFFARDIILNIHKDLFPIGISDAIEVCIVFIISIACFWFMSRNVVLKYLQSV